MDKASYILACKARGIVKFLGERWDCLAVVPDREMDAIQKINDARPPAFSYPYLQEGQRVRVTGGLLATVEGTLVQSKLNKGLLVVSIELLQRAVAVEIDCTLVVPA
jgi:transcription antitermination factor NusG